MKKNFYNLPLDFTKIFPPAINEGKGKKKYNLNLPKTTSIKQSVDDFIELLITTHLGEYKFNNEFGFEIWDIEFENLQIEKFNTYNFPRQDLEKFLQTKLVKYEPRLNVRKIFSLLWVRILNN